MPYRGGVGPSILFTLTVDDLIAYNMHWLKTSPVNRKQVRLRVLLSIPLLVIAMMGVLTAAATRSTTGLVVFGLTGAMSLWSAVLLPRYIVWSAPGRIRKAVASGSVRAPGPTRLWIDDHGVVVSEYSDRSTSLAASAIESIEETPEHVFLTVGPGQALIIPRRVGEPVVQAFLQALHWYRGQLYADPAGHPPYGPNAWSA